MKRLLYSTTFLLVVSLGLLGAAWPASTFSQAVKKNSPQAKPVSPVPKKIAPTSRAAYIGYDDARPILEALQDALPAELRRASVTELATLWPKWVAARDAEIRARLLQGDEDSVINFLLFGITFTRRPRITLDALAQAGKESSSATNTALLDAIKLRADDLIQGILAPGTNERLLFARRLAESKGFDLKAATARSQLKEYLLGTLARVLNEQSSYARILEAARLLGDPSQEFVERSKLYSARGLSSDTSLLPNFAIENALEEIKAQGLLAAASVRRVAIVGPGLDFTDKQDGYDFYPQQTIQPFAVIDTLIRLGLAKPNDLQLTTLDLSPRINDHLTRSRQRALAGQRYVVQLPRDEKGLWTADAIAYWNRFGDRIGTPATPAAVPPGAVGLKVRAVSIRPEIVRLITPQDLNIVLQRLNPSAGEGFDLIIATNILVYYEVFEQSLALKNVEAMLRPGGFLLSNNALLELPTTNVHSVNYNTVVYSDKPNDGDHIVWYQRDGKP